MTPSPRRRRFERENTALRERLADAEAAGERRESTLRFLDVMDQVHSVMQGARSVDELLEAVLDEMLTVFGCDRAWLLRPCDPEAPSWRVPMERTRPEWPGAFAADVDFPMEQGGRALMREALACDLPLAFSAGSERPVPEESARAFHIRSQLIMAVYPKTDVPWLLGIHYCASHHEPTDEELVIFRGICRRVGDSLGTQITLRDLAESEQRFRTLVEHAPDAIVVADAAGRFVDANTNAARLFGMDLPTLLTKTVADVSPAVQPDGGASDTASVEWIARCLAGPACRFEWTHLGAVGREIPCEVRLAPFSPADGLVRGSIVDISERVALEQQVRHLQKMEAVGELAGGVAHDFNNQLVVILGYVGMLRDLPGTPPRMRELVSRVERAAEDAANVTRQLLAFSRQTPLSLKIVDLSEVVRAMVPLLRRLVGGSISLSLEQAPGATLAVVDPAQFEQVVLNLVRNARDALPRGGHVRIGTTIRSEAQGEPDASDTPAYPCVAFTVEDDGDGMEPDVRARVFEPFFTTKEQGKGTGLGLSTAYGVVRQSGGTIRVDSEPGRGTTFTVLLPCAVGAAAPDSVDPRGSEPSPRSGHGTILLVEDIWAVGEVTRLILEDGGYTVQVAGDAEVALAELGTGRSFDLLLTDIVMPGMDGVELAARALERSAGLRVLYMTGYAAGATDRLTSGPGSPPVLHKPYSALQLLEAVRAVLNG